MSIHFMLHLCLFRFLSFFRPQSLYKDLNLWCGTLSNAVWKSEGRLPTAGSHKSSSKSRGTAGLGKEILQACFRKGFQAKPGCIKQAPVYAHKHTCSVHYFPLMHITFHPMQFFLLWEYDSCEQNSSAKIDCRRDFGPCIWPHIEELAVILP